MHDRQKFIYILDKFEKSLSVRKKIHEQISALQEYGFETIIIENKSCNYIFNNNSHYFKILNWLYYYIYQEKSWYNYLSEYLKNCQMNDIIYLRMPFPTLYCYQFFCRKRKFKIILEHQSIEYLEYLGKRNIIYPIFDIIFGSKIRSMADGMVGVTSQIMEYQKRRLNNGFIPGIVIGNGINPENVPMRTPPSYDGSEIHVLIASNINRSYGIDRFIRGMAQSSRKIILHIAGTGPELTALKKLVVSHKLEERVIFYGWVTGKDYDELFNKCHIGISALGAHRWGLVEASTLKDRDYCARGMPFIGSHHDPDFPNDFPYKLLINSGETLLEIKRVIEFTHLMFSDPCHHIKMRQFSKENLSWKIKIHKLVKYMSKLCYPNT